MTQQSCNDEDPSRTGPFSCGLTRSAGVAERNALPCSLSVLSGITAPHPSHPSGATARGCSGQRPRNSADCITGQVIHVNGGWKLGG